MLLVFFILHKVVLSLPTGLLRGVTRSWDQSESGERARAPLHHADRPLTLSESLQLTAPAGGTR